MATYYWVGNDGTWDSTSTTNWASSSGGAGGAGYPTILDDVVFDNSSGFGTISISQLYSFCRNFTVTSTASLAFGGATGGIAGDIFLPAGGSTIFSGLSVVCIANSAKTITTNGKALSTLTFNGVNGSWTLQGALTVNSGLSVNAGTFNTNNQSINCGSFNSSTANTRAINLGSSSLQVNQVGFIWDLSTTTNLTFNAGTSTIFIPGNANVITTFSSSSLTYNNVTLNFNNSAALSILVTGNNTFNNLTFNAPSLNGMAQFNFGGNQTVTGTLTASSATNIRRINIHSDVSGTQRTFNLAAASCANVDFRNIAVTGSIGTLTGTSIGDCNGNSGITFDAPKTVYWNLAGSQTWASIGWATSSGGTPNSANFPLAQDTCIINNAGSLGTISTVTYNIGTIDMSGRTTAGTLNVSNNIFVYGNIIFGTGMSTLSGFNFVFVNPGTTQTLNTNGVSMTCGIVMGSASGTLQLLSNVTMTGGANVNLSYGTINLNNFTLTCPNTFVVLATTVPRGIAFGTGNITLNNTVSGTNVWDAQTLTNFTITGTPTVNVTGATSSGLRQVYHGTSAGGTSTNGINLNLSAGSSINLTTVGGYFNNINLTGFTGNITFQNIFVYENLTVAAGLQQASNTGVINFAGTSVTQDFTTNGIALTNPIIIGGTGNTLRLLSAYTTGLTTASFTINSGTTFNANTFSASVGVLAFSATPNIINLASNTLTAQTVTHTAGNLIMSASLRINVTGTYTLTAGTLDFGNQSVSFGSFNSSSPGTKTVNLGSGTITLTSSGVNVWNLTANGTTLNPGTSTLNFTSASAKTMSSGASPYYNVNQGGVGTLTMPSSNVVFNSISNSVQPTTILFASGLTTSVNNLNLNGTAGNLVTIGPITAASAYTIEYTGSTVNTMNYVSVSYFTGARAGIFFATNSTNTAGNTNITFAAADTSPRYWVLGTGTWTNTATANWSTSSGGSGGASAPTIETNVIFDAASNVGTGSFGVTLTGTNTTALVCNDLTISGLDGTLTLAGTGELSVYGSLSYPATNFIRTHSGNITFRATTTGKTITSNGQQLAGSSVIFNGIGGGWTLADALNLSTAFSLSVSAGSLNTNGFSVNALQLLSTSSTVRSIILGASTVTLSSNINFTNTANLTFNAGTSTFVLSDSNISTSGATVFYNANWVGTSTANVAISGPLTFNNVQLTATSSSNAKPFQFTDNVTINGTLSIPSTTPTSRVLLFSNTLGTQRTLTVNSFTAPSDVDFRDIAIAGTASPVSGTRLGNAGGNSGITFDAPKTVYWNLAGTVSWFQTGWATTPSGTPNINNFPLAQDTAAFTDAGAISSMAIGVTNYSYPAIDMSARTSAITISLSTSLNLYGGWINGTGTTITGNFSCNFRGRGSYNIASNGATFDGGATIDCISGTYTLTSALLVTTNTFTVTSGNFNSNNQTITVSSFSSASSNTRSITLGASTINVGSSASTPFNMGSTTGLTFSGASSTINFTHNTANNVGFSGGALTYGTLNIGGTSGSGVYTLSGNGTTFNNITNTKPVAFTIAIAAGTTINFANFNVSGTAGNLITLGGASSGTTGVFNYPGTGVISVDYISAGTNNVFRPLPNVSGTAPYRWYLGANSVNTAVSTSAATLGAAFIAGNRRAYLLTTVGSYGWAVPADWNADNNNFYLIGAGGAGRSGAATGNNRAAGAGGGGGGYVGLTNLSLTPTFTLPLSVGNNASTNNKGFDTYINSQYLAGGGQAGLTTSSPPSSTGGAGGVAAISSGSAVLYNGGAGGAGAFGTAASTGYGSGAGGGAGGPLGNGGAGGNGSSSGASSNISGGGGGGNGGGSNGGNGSAALGGTGGNNAGGIGGGVGGINNPGTAGTFGGGGGGGSGGSNQGGSGGSGLDILNTVGGGGGRGGAAPVGGGTNAAIFGGGGAGGGVGLTGISNTGGTSSQGMIFIVYTPLVQVLNGDFFFLFGVL